jgi:hypothetical protein
MLVPDSETSNLLTETDRVLQGLIGSLEKKSNK